MSIGLEQLALGLGILGLACFVWPIIQRVSGKAQPEEPGSGNRLRSPIWWVGFVLTVAAIALQRIATQQPGG